MRPGHPTSSSALVRATLCQWVVSQLALADYKSRVSASLLARLLLLAASLRRSLSFVTQRCDAAPSDETVRQALLANLPGQDLLLARRQQSLQGLLPRTLQRCPHAAAIDLHGRPFYGDPNTPGVRGGQREAGTNYFWAFATLALLTPGGRYTVALVPVPSGQPPCRTVALLLAQAQRAGVRWRYLLPDKGFYDAEVITLLQGQGVPFVIPLLRRGDEAKQSGTTRFFRRDCPTGCYEHRWTAQPRSSRELRSLKAAR